MAAEYNRRMGGFGGRSHSMETERNEETSSEGDADIEKIIARAFLRKAAHYAVRAGIPAGTAGDFVEAVMENYLRHDGNI